MTQYSSPGREQCTAPASLHIAVGVIRDADNRILISRRREGTPGAGLWEFPGGKCEAGEAIAAALARELEEELGIGSLKARPLIRVRHAYPDRHVLLDTWLVTDWQGEAQGREGQTLAWVPRQELPQWDLLPANGPITRASMLPEAYLITPEPDNDRADFLNTLQASLRAGVRLLRLRAHDLDDHDYAALAEACLRLCRSHDAELLLDRGPAMVQQLGADGLHLSAGRLRQLRERPAGLKWLAASSHSAEELQTATSIGCDFAVLGPVAHTPSHPDSEPLGWDVAQACIDTANLPVYVIGGLQSRDLDGAFAAGAQGVAAIRGLWGDVV